MNILAKLAFDGTAYHGFQVQQNAVTVCQVVQDALEKLLGVRPAVVGASRTDSGVHALAYPFNFRADTSIPMEKLPLALNAHLPADIRCKAARQVPETFHARYTALGKQYNYYLHTSGVVSPFIDAYCWRIPGPLDLAAMECAAAAFVGQHNFAAFMAAGSSIAPAQAVRRVEGLTLARRGEFMELSIRADGYLYNMVRIITGTLVEVGRGRLAPGAIPAILAGMDREKAGPTAPAKGLFLAEVFYPEV